MKTLKGHVIFYDSACPMCDLYTDAFVKTGMLEKEGRAPYQSMPRHCTALVDQRRAADEIALVDKSSGRVYYGVESLFRIIAHSFPFLRPVFHLTAFAWLMKKAYRFISFNRRVIIPATKPSSKEHEPSFNARYRTLFLCFAWIATACVLNRYSHLLKGVVPQSRFYRELLICGGQMVWQGAFIFFIAPKKAWDYLGNMMTVSLAGAMALLPVLLCSTLIGQHSFIYTTFFLFVAALMLLEHIRRVSLLKLNPVLSITWVLYRLILLILIV